jgi:FkbM family methyltransferase
MLLLSRLKLLFKDLLPPILLRAIRRSRTQQAHADPQAVAMDSFYGSLLQPNSLCFDIGANIGNRVAALRRLGFRVVAVEPQPQCYSLLQSSFGADHEVTLINKAVGNAEGKAAMMLSDVHTVSTLSQAFIDATTKSGRFGDITWDKSIVVEMVTLDGLIVQHGTPDFIKVDVEGFEWEVISSLSHPIGLISLEWTPELTDSLIDCVEHLSQLGPISCNLSWGESMRLARRKWMNKEALIYILDQFREESYLFGDVYIRSTVLV